MKNLLIERLNTEIPAVAHRLYDSDGNLVARNGPSLKIRGKVRCVSKNGDVLNCSNTTIYPGRRFLLESLLRLLPNATQQLTLNTVLDINAAVTPSSPTDLLDRKICLVGVGDGGASLTFGQVYDARANDNNLFHQIPLRTVSVGSDLSTQDRTQYFMRKRVTYGADQYFNYYLKAFPIPTIEAKHQNVNYIPNEADNDPSKPPDSPLVLYNIQVYTPLEIKITENDVKGHYQAENGNLNLARFNEMALFFGIPVTVTDPSNSETYTDYIAVEAFSHLTFNNRGMDSAGSSYDFQYFLIT